MSEPLDLACRSHLYRFVRPCRADNEAFCAIFVLPSILPFPAFHPIHSARSLAAELQANLSAAHPLPSLNFPPSAFNRTPRAIIVPHAGYSYSGPAAAWAFAAIPGVLEAEARAEGTSAAEAQQSENGIKRVFVLGPSHHAYSTGISLTKFEEWETPLGGLKVDRRGEHAHARRVSYATGLQLCKA